MMVLWFLFCAADVAGENRVASVSKDGTTQGVYVEGELTNYDLALPTTLFPAVAAVGTTAQKITKLEGDLHAVLDADLTSRGITQRVRVKVYTLTPMLFGVCVYASQGEIKTCE